MMLTAGVRAATGQLRALMMAERSFEIRLVLLEALRDTTDPVARMELVGCGSLVQASLDTCLNFVDTRSYGAAAARVAMQGVGLEVWNSG